MANPLSDAAAETMRRALAEPHRLERARLLDEALRLHRQAMEQDALAAMEPEETAVPPAPQA